MSDQKISELSEYLGYLVAGANRQMRSSISQCTAEEGLTEEHWRILFVLSDEQGHSMGQLAEAVLLNHPALTKNIDKLVSRALVQRAPDADDSRRVLVFISDLGLEMWGRLSKQVDALHKGVDEALGPRKAAQLKRLLVEFTEKTGNL
jgi:DNA-binding MarR family transcriptional regulator